MNNRTALLDHDHQGHRSPPSLEDRLRRGRAARTTLPRKTLGAWEPASNRADPVALLQKQNSDRLPFLVPVRHGRMSASPFAFYRGAACVMAADLARTPTSGLMVQACGDAHLSNFGVYASPERRLVFDVNDFDETLRGPWEWDVKRLAASLLIAGEHRGFTPETCRALAARAADGYVRAMHDFSKMGVLDLWYQDLDVERARGLEDLRKKSLRKRLHHFCDKAHSRDSLQAVRKLCTDVDGGYQIKSDPPVLVPLRELEKGSGPAALDHAVRVTFEGFKETLPDDRRWLVDRFTLVDVALKVVGVGSVGTRCLIALFQGRDRGDLLFLQIKEATSSVLEEFVGKSTYDNHGRRVVEGQRLLQAVSDIFLGWARGPAGRDFYVRQLRDWKGSIDVENAPLSVLTRYADLCGRTLARGHARSGDAVAIAAYLGHGGAFEAAIGDFAVAYGRQNARDYEGFCAAISAGRISAAEG